MWVTMFDQLWHLQCTSVFQSVWQRVAYSWGQYVMTANYGFSALLCPTLLVYARWEFSFIYSWESTTLINLYRILLLLWLLLLLFPNDSIWGGNHLMRFTILVCTSSVVMVELAHPARSSHITLIWHGAFLVELALGVDIGGRNLCGLAVSIDVHL